MPRIYSGPLVLLRAREQPVLSANPAINDDETLGWAAFSAQPVMVHRVPGNHYSMMKPPHVEELANQLRASLLAADPDSAHSPSDPPL
jgi:thioesterase domain-containing protein